MKNKLIAVIISAGCFIAGFGAASAVAPKRVHPVVMHDDPMPTCPPECPKECKTCNQEGCTKPFRCK